MIEAEDRGNEADQVEVEASDRGFEAEQVEVEADPVDNRADDRLNRVWCSLLAMANTIFSERKRHYR